MAYQEPDSDSDDDAENVISFAGLTRHSEQWTPEGVFDYGSSMRWWAEERHGGDGDPDLPETSLNDAINRLPRATTAEVAWKNPVTGDWVETEKHNALVNPETVEQVNEPVATREDLEEMSDEGGFEFFDAEDFAAGDEALYYIPTSDYTIINPNQFLRPLTEVVQEQDLGDAVFGEFRLHRGGGRVSADVFFNGKHVQAPQMDDDRKPIVVGLQIDWDFFGGTSVRAQGMGMDYECVNAIRAVTDKMTVKHSGGVEERVNWKSKWEELLVQIDLKVDQLSRMIAEATEETLDVSDLPEDFVQDYDSVLEALYAYSGLPDYLANHAADNLRAEAADPFEPNFWEMHRGATYAVSHHARGDVGSGGSIEQYNGVANDMLMNPPRARQQVDEGYQAAVADEDDTLEAEGGGEAVIWADDESVQDKKEKFEEREAEIRELLPDADA